jgi:hypothetical protein
VTEGVITFGKKAATNWLIPVGHGFLRMVSKE